jgi:hypothetical protein
MRPVLAVSRGRLICLSTAFAEQGWYYDAWQGAGDWRRVKVTADQCPRISPEFLAEERAALGARWFAMEYMCEFQALAGSLFDPGDIAVAASDDVQPLVL